MADVGGLQGLSSFSSRPVIILGCVYLTFCFGWRRDGPGKSVWLPFDQNIAAHTSCKDTHTEKLPSSLRSSTSGPRLAGPGPGAPGRLLACPTPRAASTQASARQTGLREGSGGSVLQLLGSGTKSHNRSLRPQNPKEVTGWRRKGGVREKGSRGHVCLAPANADSAAFSSLHGAPQPPRTNHSGSLLS